MEDIEVKMTNDFCHSESETQGKSQGYNLHPEVLNKAEIAKPRLRGLSNNDDKDDRDAKDDVKDRKTRALHAFISPSRNPRKGSPAITFTLQTSRL